MGRERGVSVRGESIRISRDLRGGHAEDCSRHPANRKSGTCFWCNATVEPDGACMRCLIRNAPSDAAEHAILHREAYSLPIPLGLRIRAKRRDMSVRQAASESGISPATLSRIEHGKQPSVEVLLLLCKWLGIDPNTALNWPTEK